MHHVRGCPNFQADIINHVVYSRELTNSARMCSAGTESPECPTKIPDMFVPHVHNIYTSIDTVASKGDDWIHAWEWVQIEIIVTVLRHPSLPLGSTLTDFFMSHSSIALIEDFIRKL